MERRGSWLVPERLINTQARLRTHQDRPRGTPQHLACLVLLALHRDGQHNLEHPRSPVGSDSQPPPFR
ncbi:MAG TPA: hypothetical protein DIU15_16485, partial [Deltaproteobacteria bacterium]|nr:hypothetical protein [Deltaproteobacteria bacterium]